jgi:hypothetical protein
MTPGRNIFIYSRKSFGIVPLLCCSRSSAWVLRVSARPIQVSYAAAFPYLHLLEFAQPLDATQRSPGACYRRYGMYARPIARAERFGRPVELRACRPA